VIRARRLLRRLAHERRGATVVEFAIISLPLVIVLFVLVDFGFRIYLQSIVDGTLVRAARKATVGTMTGTQIDAYVTSQLSNFSTNVRPDHIAITKRSYYQFSGIGKGEKITSDTAPLGVYNVGDCYEDANNNGVYDGPGSSGTSGIGGSDDIVYYTVTVTFPSIVPLYGLMGWSSTETINSTTILRNQPYASQTPPTVRCN